MSYSEAAGKIVSIYHNPLYLSS